MKIINDEKNQNINEENIKPEMVAITGKIVTPSKPYMAKDGSRWISDLVYKRNGEYYTRKVMTPTKEYGPFEIGEEVSIDPDYSDKQPESWMIEIYQDPLSCKDILRREKYRKQDEEDAKEEFGDFNEGFGNKLLNLIIVLLVLVILGIILKTIIWG